MAKGRDNRGREDKKKKKQKKDKTLAAIIPGAVVGALIYYFGTARPQVDLRFALLLVVGSAIGAYLGARVAARIPDRPLRISFSVLLVVVGLKELVLP